MFPDDGPVRPKHVGVINFNVLISVKKFLNYKRFGTEDTSANSWFNSLRGIYPGLLHGITMKT